MGTIQHRNLDFTSGDQVIAEIQRLREVGYKKTKNWNLTQICEHLTKTMRGGMDFMWLHAAHHLGFLIPIDQASG